jgi:hypothetical protein
LLRAAAHLAQARGCAALQVVTAGKEVQGFLVANGFVAGEVLTLPLP